MVYGLGWDRPGPPHCVLYVNLHSFDGKVKQLPLLSLDQIAKENLDLRPDVGLFRFLELSVGEASSLAGVDYSVDRSAEEASKLDLQANNAAGAIQDRLLKKSKQLGIICCYVVTLDAPSLAEDYFYKSRGAISPRLESSEVLTMYAASPLRLHAQMAGETHYRLGDRPPSSCR